MFPGNFTLSFIDNGNPSSLIMVHFHLGVILEYWQWSLSFTMFSFEVMQEKYSKVKYDFYLKTKNFGDKSNTFLLTWMLQEHKTILKLKHRDSDKCVWFSLQKHLCQLCPDCTLRAGNPRVWGLAAQPLLHRANRNLSSSIHPPENHPFSRLLVLRSATAH